MASTSLRVSASRIYGSSLAGSLMFSAIGRTFRRSLELSIIGHEFYNLLVVKPINELEHVSLLNSGEHLVPDNLQYLSHVVLANSVCYRLAGIVSERLNSEVGISKGAHQYSKIDTKVSSSC